MSNDDAPEREETAGEEVVEIDWGEIKEPGCYLLVSSGLLARVDAEEAKAMSQAPRQRTGARAVRLSGNPRDSLQSLRATAEALGLLVGF